MPANQPAVDDSEIAPLLDAADALRDEGQYEKARAAYERILALQKNNMRALAGSRLAPVSRDDWAEAQRLKKQARNENFLGRRMAAYRLIRQARSLDPNSREILTLYGSSALQVQRFHEAARIFKEQWQEDPGRVDCLIGWAEAAFGAHDFEECLRALDHMAVIEDEAERDEQVAQHLCELWYTKGIAASARYRYAEAIDVLNRATKREPKKARYRDALAAAQLEAGNFENALSDLKALEKLAPDTSLLHYRQGKALERLGRISEAVLAYREELRRDRTAWRVAVDCGRAYEALGGRDNLLLALSFLEQALQSNPRSHEALFTQQAVYRKLGNREESVRVNGLYQKLIEFKEQRESELRAFKSRIDADPRDFEAWLGTIQIRSRFNPIEDVLREVHKLLIIEPAHPDGLWHLINLLLVQKKNQEAWFKAAWFIDAVPEDSRAWSLGATALYRLDRVPDALPLAERAWAMNKRDGTALEILVLCLQKTDPNGRRLQELLPTYQLMKAEEQKALERLREQEDSLDRKLGK